MYYVISADTESGGGVQAYPTLEAVQAALSPVHPDYEWGDDPPHILIEAPDVLDDGQVLVIRGAVVALRRGPDGTVVPS